MNRFSFLCGEKLLFLPEMPFPGLQDIDTKKKIRHGVRKNAMANALGIIEQHVVNNSGHYARKDVMVFETEQDDDDEKRRPREKSDGDRCEFFVDDVAQNK